MTLAERRAAVRAAFERLERAHTAIDALTEETTDEQRTAAQTEFDTAEAEHRSATVALQRDEEMEARRAALPPAADTDPEERGGGGGRVEITHEPMTYDRGQGNSYFLDLARDTVHADASARARLNQHAREVAQVMERREAAAQRAFDNEVQAWLESLPEAQARRIEGIVGVQTRDLTRVDGAGGNFVPPIWLFDQYAEAPRAGRPFVEATRQIALPGGTDSINIPKIATGTATAAQTADNAAVQETDLTDAVVTAPVRTIAGQQDLAIQLIDQSPIAFDELVFADLIADYYYRCEEQAIIGSGAAGQVKGILNASGLITITYTDATPTVPELYPKIADGLQQARTARKRPITHGWIAPRRSFWVQAALDAQNRPLVVPQIQGPFNALGVQDGPAGGGSGEDLPLRMLAPLQMTDAVPVNLGAGTNEDRIVLTRQNDHVWFEGALRARAVPETLSGNLTVRLQVYSYVAATFERFPTAIAVVAGTGLITPTF